MVMLRNARPIIEIHRQMQVFSEQAHFLKDLAPPEDRSLMHPIALPKFQHPAAVNELAFAEDGRSVILKYHYRMTDQREIARLSREQFAHYHQRIRREIIITI